MFFKIYHCRLCDQPLCGFEVFSEEAAALIRDGEKLVSIQLAKDVIVLGFIDRKALQCVTCNTD